MLTETMALNNIPITDRHDLTGSVPERFICSAIRADRNIHSPTEGILCKAWPHWFAAPHTGCVSGVTAVKALFIEQPCKLQIIFRVNSNTQFFHRRFSFLTIRQCFARPTEFGNGHPYPSPATATGIEDHSRCQSVHKSHQGLYPDLS